LLDNDPLLDRLDSPPPGWFASFDVGLVKPHVKNHLTAPVNVDGLFTDQVQLPNAELDWTGSPRIEVGYRFYEGCGEFVVSYQSLVSDGTGIVSSFDPGGDGVLRSRLNANVIDLDYASREYALGPKWDMKWRAGVRLASIFFDSRAIGFFREERSNNEFFGAGPHLGLDLTRTLGTHGLGAFARLESAAVIGDIDQNFEADVALGDGTAAGGASTAEQTQAVPVVDLQVGLSYVPPWNGRWARFVAGYEIQQWWWLGRVNDSRAELTVQGAFFRAEWGF
jgi:hypothetical protein